jgi:hypothetical protein
MTDPSDLVTATPVADAAFYDLLHDTDVVRGLQAFLAGERPYFDVELLAPDQRETLWMRVMPTMYEETIHANNWRIDDGMCQRLDEDNNPAGPVGSCNGYFVVIDSPGHTVGKLAFQFAAE